MSRRYNPLMVVLPVVILVAACTSSLTPVLDPDGPCKDVTCSGHGTCAVNDNQQAVCNCDDGYEPADGDSTACVCKPDCTGKQCGDDGCGGSCGDCTGTKFCNPVDGQCKEPDPSCPGAKDCAGRECSVDPVCGLPCGDCTLPEVCDESSGQCDCTSSFSCASLDAAIVCGTVIDNCAEPHDVVAECGRSGCTSPLVCGAGGAAQNTCGDPCPTRKDCNDYALLECGSVSDGCGGTLSLVSDCGLAGCSGAKPACTANLCVASCTSTFACGSLDAAIVCGAVIDNCSVPHDVVAECGRAGCSAPQTCGGGGVDNQCGCTPASCAQALNAAGVACGIVPNGCGSDMDCTACSAPGDTCGGGGVAGQCGCTPYASCTQALAAAGVECGSVPNGCGSDMDCTACSVPGDTCGGGGVSGQCGHDKAPAITVQPKDSAVLSSLEATFSVTATGDAPLAYQWRKNGVDIGGATASSLTTAPVKGIDHLAVYSVVVSNAFGTATSDDAELTVVIQNRLFVASNAGVLVWDNPSILAASRAADVTLGFSNPSAVTTAGNTLYVARQNGELARYDNAMDPALSPSTAPSVTVPGSAYGTAVEDIRRLAYDGSGLWVWGHLYTGGFYFPGPLSGSSTPKAMFTHSSRQTPSLLVTNTDSGSQLYMGQISGAGLLGWSNPRDKTGIIPSPANDYAILGVDAWSLGATSDQLFAGGQLKSGTNYTAGISVWSAKPEAATPPDFLLTGGAGGIQNNDFVADIAVSETPDYLVAAVQGGSGSGSGSRILYWTGVGALTASTAPTGVGLLDYSQAPSRMVVYGGRVYTLSSSANPSIGVMIHTMQGGPMPVVANVSGNTTHLDLAIGP